MTEYTAFNFDKINFPDSSAIDVLAFNRDENTIGIRLCSNDYDIYTYTASESFYDLFVKADSAGRFYSTFVKNNGIGSGVLKNAHFLSSDDAESDDVADDNANPLSSGAKYTVNWVSEGIDYMFDVVASNEDEALRVFNEKAAAFADITGQSVTIGSVTRHF